MVDGLIPEDVKAFLLKHVHSIAQLEALLLLRANPAYEWSADLLAGRLYITPQETVALLETLCTDGFLVSTDNPPCRYRYHCLANDLAAMVDRVADFYAQYLIPVTNLIPAKSRNRVQEFADAFKFRKDG